MEWKKVEVDICSQDELFKSRFDVKAFTKALSAPESDNETYEMCEDESFFYEILDWIDFDTSIFSRQEIQGMIFAAGYAVKKLIRSVKHEGCDNLLTTDEKLNINTANEYAYI